MTGRSDLSRDASSNRIPPMKAGYSTPVDSAVRYLRDVTGIFNRHGWSWTYHAFREWDGWSVEHEGMPGRLSPSKGNDRKDALLEAFRRGVEK